MGREKRQMIKHENLGDAMLIDFLNMIFKDEERPYYIDIKDVGGGCKITLFEMKEARKRNAEEH